MFSENGPRPGQGAELSVGNVKAAEATSLTHQTQAEIRRLEQIIVGERSRREMGDIAGLATSMAELGLLDAVVILPDGTLIAGERRLLLEAVIALCGIPVRKGGDKECARLQALRAFLSAHALLARRKDHQIAGAALLALFASKIPYRVNVPAVEPAQ